MGGKYYLVTMPRPFSFSTAALSLVLFAIAASAEPQCTDPDARAAPSDSVDDPRGDRRDERRLRSDEGRRRADVDRTNGNRPSSRGAREASGSDGEADADGNRVCGDRREDCAKLASEGECLIDPGYMLKKCKYSCWRCADQNEDRAIGLDEETITKKSLYADMSLGRHQLVRQVNAGNAKDEDPMTARDHQKVRTTIREMERYAKQVIASPNTHSKARERCRNEFRMCAEWASRGHCHPAGHPLQSSAANDAESIAAGSSDGGGRAKDVLFMTNMCPLACRACEEVPSLACAGKRHPNSQPLMEKSGGLNAYFESLRKDAANQRALFVSYPDSENERRKDDSYVMLLTDFISDSEAESLISLSKTMGFSSANTATCRGQRECTAHKVDAEKVYQTIMKRIAAAANATLDFLEPMKFHRLRADQPNSGPSHNYQLSGVWKPAGPRILSFRIFLSNHGSNAQLGFPNLDWLFLHPTKGMVALWPNVINENVWEMDPLTSYEYFGCRECQNEELFYADVHVRLYNWTDGDDRDCA